MNGIVFLNKEVGISSHTLVNKLRKILKIKKIGHTGTLDPMASGLMILCVGNATKLSQYFLSKDKSYLAKIEFGYETDTLDLEGNILNRSDKKVTKANVLEAIQNINKKVQIPPKFSAIKVQGKRAYKLAKQNKEFEIEARAIEINKIELRKFKDKVAEIYCDVSKGTYIRSLARDLGILCGSYATLVSLVRLSISNIYLEESHTIEEIENLFNKEDLSFLKSPENLLQFPKIEIEDKQKFILGAKMQSEAQEGIYKIYCKGEFIGVALQKEGKLRRKYVI